MDRETHLSQAICAQTYALAPSSFGFSEPTRCRESAMRDCARSTSSRGRGPVRVGIRPVRVFSRDLLFIFCFAWGDRCGEGGISVCGGCLVIAMAWHVVVVATSEESNSPTFKLWTIITST